MPSICIYISSDQKRYSLSSGELVPSSVPSNFETPTLSPVLATFPPPPRAGHFRPVCIPGWTLEKGLPRQWQRVTQAPSPQIANMSKCAAVFPGAGDDDPLGLARPRLSSTLALALPLPRLPLPLPPLRVELCPPRGDHPIQTGHAIPAPCMACSSLRNQHRAAGLSHPKPEKLLPILF